MSGISYIGAGRAPFELRSSSTVGVSVGTEGKLQSNFVGAGSDVTNDSTAPGASVTDVLDFLYARTGLLSRWTAGRRYFTSSLTGSTTTTHGPVFGIIYYSQIFIPEEYQLDKMSFALVSGAGFGLNVRMAIYTDASGSPGDLVHDTGNVSAANLVPPIKQANVSAVTTGPGHNWMAIQASSAALTFVAAPQLQIGPYLGEKDDTTAFAQGITQRTEGTAATPFPYGPFPATATPNVDVTSPVVLMGLSRL